MSKSLAIAVSLCLVALSVSDVEAGIFGRRSGSCRGGNCYRNSAPSYRVTQQPVTVNQPVYSQRIVTSAKPVSQPQNGNAVRSPSDIVVPQAPAAAATAAPRVIYSSPCAGGNCYTPQYRSSCAGGNCQSRSYSNGGWYRSR
jgi:hypothetical protein